MTSQFMENRVFTWTLIRSIKEMLSLLPDTSICMPVHLYLLLQMSWSALWLERSMQGLVLTVSEVKEEKGGAHTFSARESSLPHRSAHQRQ